MRIKLIRSFENSTDIMDNNYEYINFTKIEGKEYYEFNIVEQIAFTKSDVNKIAMADYAIIKHSGEQVKLNGSMYYTVKDIIVK